VLNLNREDRGHRKYLLVEMGDHFDGVLMPRIKKVIYSKDWKEGKPVSREGSSHIFKYFRMESYEDALNGIRFTHEQEGQSALKFMEDEYRLGYWLDFETQGSDTLLNVEKLAAPFEYTLEVFANGEKQVKKVDLPETFNYLIGLIVDRRRPLELNGRQYLLYTGTLRAGSAKTAVLWRDIRGWKPEDFDKERKVLAKEGVLSGFATIYVNGDSAIENAQSLDPVFKARMFAPLT
jgi:adenine-specific DNA-methyltransferase